MVVLSQGHILISIARLGNPISEGLPTNGDPRLHVRLGSSRFAWADYVTASLRHALNGRCQENIQKYSSAWFVLAVSCSSWATHSSACVLIAMSRTFATTSNIFLVTREGRTHLG